MVFDGLRTSDADASGLTRRPDLAGSTADAPFLGN
jgi:hypothetical protein